MARTICFVSRKPWNVYVYVVSKLEKTSSQKKKKLSGNITLSISCFISCMHYTWHLINLIGLTKKILHKVYCQAFALDLLRFDEKVLVFWYKNYTFCAMSFANECNMSAFQWKKKTVTSYGIVFPYIAASLSSRPFF